MQQEMSQPTKTRIKRIEVIPSDVIEGQLRQVPLLLNPDVKPWQAAIITWELYDPQVLWPASLYVLNPLLETLRDARQQILDVASVDILNLTRGLSYRRNGQIYRIIPPLVEEIAEDGLKGLDTRRNLAVLGIGGGIPRS